VEDEMDNSKLKNSSSKLAIEVKGLRKSYGKVQALRGIDLEVRSGEIFGFLGPNGAGKTTTIRCMLDMIRPDGGNIRLLNMDPQTNPVSVQALTGYLPGEMQYYDNLTSERQLCFFNDMRGRRAEWEYVKQLANRLSLDLKQPIKNLSKGNKQKVGVIQALMHRPALLLLDEPTSGLDPLMQREVLSLLREANSDGTTIFFSSHIMSEVESLAERVAIIRAGEIVEVTDTTSLTHSSVNRITIRFKHPIDFSGLVSLTGVKLLSQVDQERLTLEVVGDMERLVQAMSQLPVLDLETDRPSLEEVFLTYYQKESSV
jgi:ABC-2 type transport system ATP-binding protein